MKALSRRFVGPMAAVVDRVATAVVRGGRHHVPIEVDERKLEALVRAAGRYDRADAELFPAARLPDVIEAPCDDGALDATFVSRHEPLTPPTEVEPVDLPNRLVHLRYRTRPGDRGQPRPTIVCIHGYLAGDFSFEQRVWPLERFNRRGFDTVLFTLPFHGRRATPGARSAPSFPSEDPIATIEGFRQSLADLSDTIRFLRETRQSPAVGLLGMSLGGYTAALASTVQSGVDFCIPVIPLACLADFAREQGNLPRTPERAFRLEEAIRRAYRVVSPFTRPSRLGKGRALVVGGHADRITSVNHARRLAHHLGAPLHVWPGGHLLQWGRGEAFDRIDHFLRVSSFTPTAA